MSEFKEKEYQVFDMFHNQWALVSAGNMEHFNTCTIGWGSLGTLWRRPVVTVYVNPDRYTWEFLKENDTFTVSFFDEKYKKALGYLGAKSGRDEDKVKNAGLSPKEIHHTVTFKEANLTFVCKKLYEAPFEREGLADEINNGIYKNWQPHWMFAGEVIETEDLR